MVGSRSDVDGVSMLLAQGLVFFGEERLAFQRSTADCAHKAGVMPGKSQSLKKFIPCFNGEVAAMAIGPKQCVVVFFAVGLSILHVKSTASNWLLASGADKTRHVPGLFQSIHNFPKNLVLAAETGGCEHVLVAACTVHLALLLHKTTFYQRGVAVIAVEFLRVPGHAQCHKEWSSDDIVALLTHRCPSACWDVLRPLDQRV